jgi:hypothetical protein
MNYSRKMILMPSDVYENQQVGSAGPQAIQEAAIPSDQPPIVDRHMNKIYKLLSIVLKIALKNGYNDDYRINDAEGNPIVKTNVAKLVQYAISPDKAIVGENDFVRLLYDSNVDPNWIVNQRLRNKLLNYKQTRPKTLNISRPAPPPPPPPHHMSTQISPVERNIRDISTQVSPPPSPF